jgi:tetratricopeptide (TPR) repeat protein
VKKLGLLFFALSVSSVLVDFSGQPAHSNNQIEIKELFSLARNGTRKQWDQSGIYDAARISDSWKYSRREDLIRLIHDCDQKALASYHKGDLASASDRLFVGLSCAAALGRAMLSHEGSSAEINSTQSPPLVWLDVFKELSVSNSKGSHLEYSFPTSSYIPAVNNYAYYLRQEGKYKESIPIFEKIISTEPARIVTNLDLADAFWEIGEKEKARPFYAKYSMAMKKAKFKTVPPRVLERSGHQN